MHLLTGDGLREIGQLPIGSGATWALATYSADGSVLSAVDERGRVVGHPAAVLAPARL